LSGVNLFSGVVPVLTALLLSEEGPRELDLFALWRRIHKRGALVAEARRRLAAHAGAGRLVCKKCRLPVQARLFEHRDWRFVHARPQDACDLEGCELVKWELGRELVRRHAPELEVLTFEARLPGPHREVLWAPALARIRGLERVYEIWEEGREPLEDAQHRTRLHERMGRQVFWVILEAPSHSAIERWLHREGRPHYRAFVHSEMDSL